MELKTWVQMEQLRLNAFSDSYFGKLEALKLQGVKRENKAIPRRECQFSGSLWDDCERNDMMLCTTSKGWRGY
jgi:hypothetical protein